MKKHQPCENCGELLKRVRVMYGYPTRETFERAERGELVLGGCDPGGPAYVCWNCHRMRVDSG